MTALRCSFSNSASPRSYREPSSSPRPGNPLVLLRYAAIPTSTLDLFSDESLNYACRLCSAGRRDQPDQFTLLLEALSRISGLVPQA